jgi:sigma-B regulation protein RsbU (phosphoserine phosphatase)
MREACELQKRLLPKYIHQIPGIDIAADWKPARSLGGDYFDVLRFRDGTVGLCVADVEGKGVAAALIMSQLQSAVKAFSGPSVPPSALAQRLNSIFCEEVQAERSISFFYAHMEPATGKVTYCNAGHPAAIVIRASGVPEKLESGGAVLGRLPGWIYEDAESKLHPGDVLALYTDGISEATDTAQQEFSENRIIASLQSCAAQPASDILRTLLANVENYCGNRFHDDATVMIAKLR